MNAHGKHRVEPPDFSRFHENRWNVSFERLVPYHGKYVGWSLDGTHVLASGDTEEEMERNLVALGIAPSQVVGEFIPPPE